MKDYTTELLGMEGVLIEKIENEEKIIKIYVKEPIKQHVCPCCGQTTTKVHDYRKRKIKDVPIREKAILIIYNRRRYKCCHCGKNINEHTSLIGKHASISQKVVLNVINRLKDLVSFKQVAKENNISITSVIRFFDYVKHTCTGFQSEVLCIDEFKGNVDGNKYQAAIVDPTQGKIVNVYSKRHKHYLISELLKIQKKERLKIKYFITDMWDSYIDIGESLFKNATVCIDRFHYVKVITEAMQTVRKRIQNTFGIEYRKYFKHSRRLLLCRKEKLKEEDKEKLNEMLRLSGQLRESYKLLQKFYEFSSSKTIEEAKKQLKLFCDEVENSQIEEFEKALKTILRYQKYIMNSFKTKYTNSYAEGNNNLIKVIKRISFGYRNGKRFIQRILHYAG